MDEQIVALSEWFLALWTITPGWVISTVIMLVALHQTAHWVKDQLLRAVMISMRLEMKDQRSMIAESTAHIVNRALHDDKLNIEESVRKAVYRPD